MKFLEDYNKYLNSRLKAINENFDATLLEYKIIITDVTKEQVKGNYVLLYKGKEMIKGQALLRNITEGNLNYYGASYKLDKPEYLITGTFDIHISIKDAKKDAKLVAKIGNTAANLTGIYNTKLSERPSLGKPEPLDLDLGNFFAPNVDTIDESKKTELNEKLSTLEEYFKKQKSNLTRPGAEATFNIIGGASQVSTTYVGGNQKLAEARANNLKKYMIEYFKTSNPDLSRYIGDVAKVTTVMGETPYIDVKTKYAGKTDQVSIDAANKDNVTNDANKDKYAAEQFVKLSIKAN